MRKIFISLLLSLTMAGCYFNAYAQKKGFVVTGKVTDTENVPLIGVTVRVYENDNIYTVTDNEGCFTLNLEKAKTVLLFTYVSMKDTYVDVNGRKTITVVMEEDAMMLDEVVAIGYGTAKRSDLTGSVASIRGQDLVASQATTLAEALQGRLPGVIISSASGEIDADVSVRVRGGVSITQDNSPLYIVDGFPMADALRLLDPADVESIDVLKDASATAIYGSRGANGVFIIKTKEGRKNTHSISYEGTLKINRTVLNGISWLGPIDYLRYDYQRTSVTNLKQWENRYGKIGDIYENYADAEGVDWQKELLGKSRLSHKHTVNINGGGEFIDYNLSYIYDDMSGAWQSTGRKKHSVRLSLNTEVSRRLRFGVNMSYITDRTKGNGSYTQDGKFTYGVFQCKPVLGINEEKDGIFIDPDDPEENANPNNPVNLITSLDKKTVRTTANMNFNADLKILESLVYSVRIGYTLNGTETSQFYNSNSAQAIQLGAPFGTTRNVKYSGLTGTQTLRWQTKIFKNRFDVIVGHEVSGSNSTMLEYGAHGFPDVNFGMDHIGMATEPDKFLSNKYAEREVSVFGRINYSLPTHLFTLTMRADGSSKFSKKHKWGYFPAGAYAWRLSEEPFIKKLGVFHNLKLRLSYGLTGNNNIADYCAWPLMGSSWMPVNNQQQGSFIPASIGNDDLKWETNAIANIGLDMAFFKGRLSMNMDLYRTDTKDLLMNAKLQPSSGYATQIRNVGATVNEGIELLINSHNIKSRNFNWLSTLTLSFSRSTVKKLAGSSVWYVDSNTNKAKGVSYYDFIYEEGRKIGAYYGFIYDGLYQADDFTFENGKWTLKDGIVRCDLYPDGPQPGYAKYKNMNPESDNVVTNDDRTVIGYALPVCNGGFHNTFAYKSISLSVLCNFKIGGKIYNGNIYRYLSPTNSNNTVKFVYDNMYDFLDDDGTRLLDTGNVERLMEKNKGKIYPRVGDLPFSTMMLTDASFFRIANVNIAWSIPSRWIKHIWMKEAALSFSVQNLAVWSSYKQGYDPEVSMNANGGKTPGIDKGSTPRDRSFTFNLRIAF